MPGAPHLRPHPGAPRLLQAGATAWCGGSVCWQQRAGGRTPFGMPLRAAPTHAMVLPASCGLQDDDIPGIVRYRTYEVLKEETANPRLR